MRKPYPTTRIRDGFIKILSRVVVDLRQSYRTLFKTIVRTPWLTRSRTLARLGPRIPFAMYDLDEKLSKYLGFREGYFVEAGAYDGLQGSNTKYLELYQDWRGILVEPLPAPFKDLRTNRRSKSLFYNKALVSFGFPHSHVKILVAGLMSIIPLPSSEIKDAFGHAKSGMSFVGNGPVTEILVETVALNDLLRASQAPLLIDFLSLDTEGSELEVLKGIDHSEFRFRYILIEVWNREAVIAFLGSVGYSVLEDFGGDILFSGEK